MPMEIGNGRLDGLQPGGLPAAVVEQQNMAAGVAGNGPAFSAYATVATNVANVGDTKINLGGKQFDTDNAFDVTTSQFKPNVPGYYLLIGAVRAATSYTGGAISIFKNGAAEKSGDTNDGSGSTDTNGWQVTGLVYLNGTTDYVELRMRFVTAQNCGTGISSTYFQGFLARAA